MTDFTFVDEPDAITAELRNHELLGVDTEFMRERTYFAQLCLVQLATRQHVYCVDPLVEDPMEVFWDELCARTWVVHSARQDIEVIYQSAARVPAALFDTQIAAALLGLQPQMGYAGLVKELFAVDIPKSHTRADWTRRPLPDALLRYAVEDVQYLLPAYDTLRARLERAGRLHWLEQDSAALLDESLYDPAGAAAIERLKGARYLQGQRRAAAAHLAEWRESEALQRNRPRQWILRDRVLLEIATKLPGSMQALRQVDDLPPKLARKSGDELLRIVAGSKDHDPNYEPPAAPDEAQKELLKSMQAAVAECARKLGISAEILAPRKELSAIIIGGDRDARVLQGWRRDVIGEKLLQQLERFSKRGC